MRSNRLAAAALVGVGAAAAASSEEASSAALVGIGAAALAFMAIDDRGGGRRYDDRRDDRPYFPGGPSLCLGIDQSWRAAPIIALPCPGPCPCRFHGCGR